jgi:hypothetical protein
MESELAAGLMSLLTATAGFLGAPIDNLQDNHGHDHSTHSHGEEERFEFGSSHEHALFFLNVEGEEVNFTQRRYQLQSNYVHLENFKPHIVHKHTENVSWEYFLDTIDVNVNQSCVSFKDRTECGNASVIINGEASDLDKKIEQGDNLAIFVNPGKIEENYMRKKLPEDYTKKASTRTI